MNNKRSIPVASAIISIGVASRIIIWQVYPPVWKTHAILHPLKTNMIKYVIDFQSYTGGRMAFFDVISLPFYLVFEPIFGIKALSIFTVMISCLSLPFFYQAVKKVYSVPVGIFSLALFSLYPKSIVLAGRGMPEAATLSFIAFFLYGLIKGSETGRLVWYAFAGISALLSFLVFLPSMLLIIIFSFYLYYKLDLSEVQGMKSIIPSLPIWAFSLPPGVMGILYLLEGPLLSGKIRAYQQGPLFVRDYPIFEKVIRYAFNMHFDFWWHQRGCDQETCILAQLGNIQNVLDGFFQPYILFWFGITFLLTAGILYGFSVIALGKYKKKGLLLAWLIAYSSVKVYEHIGWTGDYQTRQIIPIIPAVAVTFGIGFDVVVRRLSETDWEVSTDQIRKWTYAFVIILFVVLILNSAIHGILQPGEQSKRSAVAALEENVQNGDTVGVIGYRDYTEVLIYSKSTVIPIVISQKGEYNGAPPNPLSDMVYVTPMNLSKSEIDLIYVQHSCSEFDDYERSYIRQAAKNGEVVYENSMEVSGCRSNAIIIRLRSHSG